MSRRQTPERAAVRVARHLVSEIRRRRLRPGTPLPAEHQMIQEFGVARATVRDALRFLELEGALRVKAGPGGGPVVSAPGADHLASVLSLHLQFADASFRSVVEARRSIYPVLAAEAAQNASREDIAALHAGLAQMHVAARAPELFREEARRFMNLIAAASGNRVLAILSGSAAPPVGRVRQRVGREAVSIGGTQLRANGSSDRGRQFGRGTVDRGKVADGGTGALEAKDPR